MEVLNALEAQVVSFAKSNPAVFLIAVIILAFLIYRKPLLFLAIFCLILLLAGVFYTIMDTSRSGVSVKQRMIHREEVPQNIFMPSGPPF